MVFFLPLASLLNDTAPNPLVFVPQVEVAVVVVEEAVVSVDVEGDEEGEEIEERIETKMLANRQCMKVSNCSCHLTLPTLVYTYI